MNQQPLDLGTLLDNYRNPLCFFAFKMLKDKDQAQEAVADVYIRVLNKDAPFEGITDIRAYLYKAVRNACLNVQRRKLVPASLTDPLLMEDLYAVQEASEMAYAHDIIHTEMISLLSQLIDALPDQQREIISRRYFNEEKIADIAAGMGLSEYQVRTYGADAINKLKINALKAGKLQRLLLVALLQALLR